MITISSEEILNRAYKFLKYHENDSDERQQSQMWIRDFLDIFNIPIEKINIGFEWRVNIDGSQKYVDHLLNGTVLIEMKSRNKNLDKAKSQAFRYVMSLEKKDIPKYVILCNFERIQLFDLKSNLKKWDFRVIDLPKYIDVFDFLINKVSNVHIPINPVNEKAAKLMEGLHKQILKAEYPKAYADLLMTRIVFCLFAENSGIFERNQFINFLKNETREDGSDLVDRLSVLFKILNTPEREKTFQPKFLKDFPYINGGLFEHPQLTGLTLTTEIRKQLLKTAELDWSKISPVIFGSMFEGAMDEQRRHNLGAHYTSEKNILKVIDSLFLNELKNEFEHIRLLKRGKEQKLQDFHNKLANLHFLDPACGSGNFLIVAYRELRRLEHEVIDEIVHGQTTFTIDDYIKIEVNQFYGIEIVPYAVSIARVGLWLMDHLMNLEASELFGVYYARLPLHAGANIFNEDALVIDWKKIIPPSKLNYILGNPPFIGRRNSEQKNIELLATVAPSINNIRSLDFVSGWYVKSAKMCEQNDNIKVSLVSTNSIAQGLHSVSLWPYLFEQGIIINFAHQTFNWDNNGAHIHCVIIGFSKQNNDNKYLFYYENPNGHFIKKKVNYINEYLIDSKPVYIKKRSSQISNFPEIQQGSMPIDDGNLILTLEEADYLIKKYPILKDYIHNYMGGQELIKGIKRKILYLNNFPTNEMRKIPEIVKKVNNIKEYRLSSSRRQTRSTADFPYMFAQDHVIKGEFLVIPQVSSINREYIPMGYESYPTIVAAPTFQVPNASKFLFAVLQSKMHMAWVKIIGGKLKSDYRYSNYLVYNTFVFPKYDLSQQNKIEDVVDELLLCREKYALLGQTLSDIYDNTFMPKDLRIIHKKLDVLIERLYRSEPFISDEERIEYLIKLYNKNNKRQQ
ncbi:N-6 DNA methylase [Paenibacillus hunanensis]|uniref:class I SAM-dependent DNA methyltransferase n=1 Tax=Paenibacillus hunanensis TaxID=539262 RepID=UPI0020273F49|nr:DNA methyltransferase [Paenibacillus hunanensis]MCL9660681.1 N-6 DNA methylase [Paenibacillus hunanensis]